MNCVSPGPLLARKGFSRFLFFLLLSSLDHHQVSASGDATNKDSNSVVVGVPKKSLFCPPLVCSCSDVDLSANCSRRGFLSTPPALPAILRHLDLSNNDLESVNSSEIIRLTQLETLDLSFNRLTELVISGRHYHLLKLDLSSNNISSVRGLRLDGLIHLSEINLSNNKLISLPPNSFSTSGMLRKLNLKGNRIVSLEAGCLDNLTSLEELLLAKNKLSSFPKGIFSEMKNLQILDLNKNKFVEIQGLSFHGLDNLKILRLRRNQIEYLMDGAFFGLNRIEELSLDRNKVPTVNKGWLYGLTTLRFLSLSFNRVDYISDDAWEFCRELTELDLRSNKLQLLDRFALAKLPSLRRLHLQDNKISHIEGDEDDRRSAFAEVPLLESLALDGNEISHTIEDMAAPFRHLSNLQVLTLSRNQIKSVGNQALVGLSSLQEIDLSDNIISTVQENAFIHLPQLHSIKINSDSMLCDCYLKWFPRWLNETKVRGGQARCAHPENLKGRLVTQIPYESYTCDDFPKPYILKQPETQITLHGNNLTLYCRAASTSPAEMTFVWKIDNDVIDDVGIGSNCTGRCIYYRPHSFDGKGREVTSELQLTNLTYTDAGRYQCVVSNKYGATYSDRANITVYVYPTFIVTPEDITVKGGSGASMKCAAQGVPAPKVAWSKDSGTDFPAASERRITYTTFPMGQERRTIVNSFIIRDVKAIDMGIYTCTASNPAGSISWNISLSVLESPRFVKPMEDKKCVEDETAVIECMVSGSPKPRLTWSKDGEKLDATERHFFAADNQLLIVVKARPTDAGSYQCSVQNPLGTETQTSRLIVEPLGVVAGSGSSDSGTFGLPDRTTAIIIIAVVICILGTSLVWMIIICKSRRRRRQRHASSRHPSLRPNDLDDRKNSGNSGTQQPMLILNPHCKLGDREFIPIVDAVREADVESPLSLPPSDESRNNQNWDSASERDSGTGDSKKSSEHVDETDAAKMDSVVSNQGGGESRISLSDFEVTETTRLDNNSTTEEFPYADDDLDEVDEIYKLGVAADSGCGEALMGSGPGSLISVTLRRNLARSLTDDSSIASGNAKVGESVTSSESSKRASASEQSKSVTPQPPSQTSANGIPFRTFRPLQASQNHLNANGDVSNGLTLLNGSARKRASAIELNGECYLAIEAADALAASAARLDPAVYRGGVGSGPPKPGLELQQRLLEESLNNTDYMISDDSRLSMRRHSRERASMLNISSKGPLFRGPRTQQPPPSSSSSSYYNSLPRRKSKQAAAKYKKLMAQLSADPDRTDVANKSTDKF